MRFVFVESSIETIPEEISDHPVIRRDAERRKKPGRALLLDDSLHHQAMKDLEKREKRGRPDIVHHCLLALLDSSLKSFELYVHTVNDRVIWIDRYTRIPRNYNRFKGLIEDLFHKEKISSAGKILMEVRDLGLSDLLSQNTVVMKEGYGIEGLKRGVKKGIEDLCICIGAFPHGDFDSRTLEIFKEKNAVFAGFGDTPKTSLYATYKTVCFLESANNFLF